MEKRPREYAAEIITLPSREARIAALNSVPDNLRNMVRAHVEDYFNRRRNRRIA